jgi:hypothetical protein
MCDKRANWVKILTKLGQLITAIAITLLKKNNVIYTLGVSKHIHIISHKLTMYLTFFGKIGSNSKALITFLKVKLPMYMKYR